MKKLTIYEYQAKAVKNALRLTANLNKCRGEKTAYDRAVILAVKYIDKTLKPVKDGNKKNDKKGRN